VLPRSAGARGGKKEVLALGCWVLAVAAGNKPWKALVWLDRELGQGGSSGGLAWGWNTAKARRGWSMARGKSGHCWHGHIIEMRERREREREDVKSE